MKEERSKENQKEFNDESKKTRIEALKNVGEVLKDKDCYVFAVSKEGKHAIFINGFTQAEVTGLLFEEILIGREDRKKDAFINRMDELMKGLVESTSKEEK